MKDTRLNDLKGYCPAWLGWLIWGLVATLYLLGFFQRMAPAGGPTWGALSDRIGLRKPPYLVGTVLTTLFWSVFLFVDLPYVLLYPLLAAVGFTSGALIIGFAFEPFSLWSNGKTLRSTPHGMDG